MYKDDVIVIELLLGFSQKNGRIWLQIIFRHLIFERHQIEFLILGTALLGGGRIHLERHKDVRKASGLGALNPGRREGNLNT